MFRTWRIGRIFGVPTELHWSFLLVPVAILLYAYEPGRGFAGTQVRWWSGMTVLLFTFVLFHELGHALMATNRGVKAEKIILFPLGGGALIPTLPKRTLDEVLIYFAGPAANLVLALLALPLLLGQPGGAYLIQYYFDPGSNLVVIPSRLEQLLGITVAVNAVLALGNLLPAYPLDGGRILRALLRRFFGDRSATVVATLLGIVVGGGLLLVALYLADPLLGISALFIIGFSAAELNRGWQRRQLTRTSIGDVIRRPMARRIYVRDGVTTARDVFAATDAKVLPVYDNWNELAGFVEREVLLGEAGEGDRVGAHYEAEFLTASPHDNLLQLTEAIVAADVYGAAIYDKGRIVGFVLTEDVITLLDRSPRRFYRRFA